MNFIYRFKSMRPWTKGGLVGIFVSWILYVFYLYVYFPIAELLHPGEISFFALLPAIITGHAFPLLSGFLFPYGWLCRKTIPFCTNTKIGGECLNEIMVPTDFCARLSEVVGHYLLIIILFALYFVIGAVIGVLLDKRKKKSKSKN